MAALLSAVQRQCSANLCGNGISTEPRQFDLRLLSATEHDNRVVESGI